MAINLTKSIINPFVAKPSDSWADFYYNMAINMLQNTLIHETTKQTANLTGLNQNSLNLIDNSFFANQLADEYHKVIKAGKTIIGGVPFTGGNVLLMKTALLTILNTTVLDKNISLLERIGPAIQIYWTGATSAKIPTPTIPCVGAVANLTTNIGLNFSPGLWTIAYTKPINEPWPFLLNFIISANLHLLTVGGMFSCNCQYPPPAPPALGILPWVGYITKPLSGNPFTGKSWVSILKAAGVTLAEASLASAINLKVNNKSVTAVNIGNNIIKGFTDAGTNTKLSQEQQNAMLALASNDLNKITLASQTLNKNKKV